MNRRRRENGATVVEAAFAVPILFMFIFALVDLGMWSFNSNQAANAARDGARAGIIDHEQADIPGSDAHDAIIETIEAHVPGRDLAPGDVIVTCVDRDGDAIVGGCSAAQVDEDRIRVDVRWEWPMVTPIAGAIGSDRGEARGVATMAIVGAPIWGTPPTTTTTPTTPSPTAPTTTEAPPTQDCTISNLTVTDPVFIDRDTGGRLRHTIVVRFQTNGADRCNGLAVQITTPPPGNTVLSAICDDCEESSDHEWDFVGHNGNSGKIWDLGQATVRVFNSIDIDGDGAAEPHVDVTKSFQVKRG